MSSFSIEERRKALSIAATNAGNAAQQLKNIFSNMYNDDDRDAEEMIEYMLDDENIFKPSDAHIKVRYSFPELSQNELELLKDTKHFIERLRELMNDFDFLSENLSD